MKEKNRRKELEHLRGALKCIGYPDWILRELRDDNSDEGGVKRPEAVKETSDKEMNKKFQWSSHTSRDSLNKSDGC